MIDWDKLKVFYSVVESGSFTRAAARLQIGQSAVSRQISALEDRVGGPLFYRYGRGLQLTEQGKILFRTAREVFLELVSVQARIREKSPISESTLSVTASIGFGTSWFTPRINKFLKAHPDLRLSLRLSDDPVDLTSHESDVALTVMVTEEANLVYRKLLHSPLRIYASSEYLFKFGIPLTLGDLDHHRLVVFSGKDMVPFDNANWLLTCGTPPGVMREAYLSLNNLHAIACTVEGGAGIACLPPYITKRHKNIVQILPEASTPSVHFYFVYPGLLRESKKIEALWNFLKKEIEEDALLH